MDVDQHIEFIKRYLPEYLTPDQKEDLFKIIKEDFPKSDSAEKIYFTLEDNSNLLQGEAIIDVPFAFLDLEKGVFENNYGWGLVMTNSCDISPENKRLETPIIQFAAIYKLSDYIGELEGREISIDRIKSFINDLKANRISNLFYLPKIEKENTLIMEESFVRFDFNTSITSEILSESRYDLNYMPEGDKIFTLSNYGFYLLLIKLSIHYCRFREGVFRNN